MQQYYLVEIENLTQLCEKSKNTGGGTGEGISELSKQKQAFQKERDQLIEETQKLRVGMQEAEEQIMELEASSAEGKHSTVFTGIDHSFQHWRTMLNCDKKSRLDRMTWHCKRDKRI